MPMLKFAPSTVRKVERLVALLPNELHQPWTPDRLSASVKMSQGHLRKLFIELTGDPPMRWLKRLRLLTASEALRRSSVPVKQVASAVGYRDVSHFVRAFRQEFGQSPAIYRHTFSNGNGAR